MTDKTAARIALLAALTLFGFALVPVAFGDKGGNPNGGNGGGSGGGPGGGNGGVVTSTTSLTSTSATTTTAASATTTASTTSTSSTTTTSTTPTPTTFGTLAPSTTTVWLNPNAPPWCLGEDDFDLRGFSGSLNGSYATSFRLCGVSDYYNGVWWDAGGVGLESNISVVGQLDDLSITAPDGSVHHAVLTSQNTVKGVTTSYYGVCYMPPFSLSSGTGGTPLQGGTWQVTLSGQISKATWSANAEMGYVNFQQTYCPASEQNLGP